jgi:hypothetical protein
LRVEVERERVAPHHEARERLGERSRDVGLRFDPAGPEDVRERPEVARGALREVGCVVVVPELAAARDERVREACGVLVVAGGVPEDDVRGAVREVGPGALDVVLGGEAGDGPSGDGPRELAPALPPGEGWKTYETGFAPSFSKFVGVNP